MTEASQGASLEGLPLLYPDPPSHVSYIDGAVFLYFPKIAAPLPAQPRNRLFGVGCRTRECSSETAPHLGQCTLCGLGAVAKGRLTE